MAREQSDPFAALLYGLSQFSSRKRTTAANEADVAVSSSRGATVISTPRRPAFHIVHIVGNRHLSGNQSRNQLFDSCTWWSEGALGSCLARYPNFLSTAYGGPRLSRCYGLMIDAPKYFRSLLGPRSEFEVQLS